MPDQAQGPGKSRRPAASLASRATRDASSRPQHPEPAAAVPTPRNGQAQRPECVQFQDSVAEYLIRHRSVLDVLSKLQESSARVQRAVSKAVTSCGCIGIHANRQELPPDISYSEMKGRMKTHLEGQLCEHCHEVVEMELGRALFYLAAACEVLGLEMDEVMKAEQRRVQTLGVFNLT